MGFMISHWEFSQLNAICHSEDDTRTLDIHPEHWYHCERQHPDLRQWLLKNRIPSSIVKHFLSDESRPSFHQYDEQHFMLILRGMNMNKNATPEAMLSVRILFYHGALISTLKVPSHAINEIQYQLSQHQGPKQLSELLIQIIDGLNGNIDKYFESVEQKIEAWSLEQKKPHALIPMQKTLLRMKRFIRPQQYAIRDLAEAELSLLSKHSHPLHHTLNNIIRINETMDFYLGELELLKEEWHQYQEEKLSKNSYVFTIVATIFLPASFLTGLLGVNIGGIPGTSSPFAFSIFCILLIALFLLELWLLRRMRFMSKSW